MEKTFKRPSQQMKDIVAGATPVEPNAGVSVAIPGDKDQGQNDADKFVKFGEATNVKLNMFKASVANKPSNKWYTTEETAKNGKKLFDIKHLKSLSAKVSIYDLKRHMTDYLNGIVADLCKCDIEKISRLPIDANGDLNLMNSNKVFDPAEPCGVLTLEDAIRLVKPFKVYKDIVLTKGKDKEKQMLIVLNKNILLNTQTETIQVVGGAPTGSIEDSFNRTTNDLIKANVIPDEIKRMAMEPCEVKSYGDDLVLVADPFKVLVQLVLPRMIQYTTLEDIKSFTKMSQPVFTGVLVNFLLAFDAPKGTQGQVMLEENMFTCCRLQMSHSEFEVAADELVNGIEAGSSVVFVKTNMLALQPSGVEALRGQLTGATSATTLQTIPLIRVPREKYSRSKIDGNGKSMIDLLISNSVETDYIDTNKTLTTFETLLDGKVYSFNINGQYGTLLTILPDYRKLVLAVVAASSRLTADRAAGSRGLRNEDIMKCDIADDGRNIAIHLSI